MGSSSRSFVVALCNPFSSLFLHKNTSYVRTSILSRQKKIDIFSLGFYTFLLLKVTRDWKIPFSSHLVLPIIIPRTPPRLCCSQKCLSRLVRSRERTLLLSPPRGHPLVAPPMSRRQNHQTHHPLRKLRNWKSVSTTSWTPKALSTETRYAFEGFACETTWSRCRRTRRNARSNREA